MIFRFIKSSPVLDRIRLAKKRLRENGWTRGQNIAPSGARCLYGALLPNGHADATTHEAVQIVLAALPSLDGWGSPRISIQEFNDRRAKSKEDVLAVLDAAERRLLS